MRLTLRGTLAEISRLREELVIVHLVASGGVRVLHLADAKITAHPYSDHSRLDADLVEDASMPELTNLLEDLRCSVCGTLDSVWLYPVRGVVECRECGSKATILTSDGGEA